jgi:hypothetical protein
MLGYIREVLFPLASVSVFLPLKENVVRVERLDVRRCKEITGNKRPENLRNFASWGLLRIICVDVPVAYYASFVW